MGEEVPRHLTSSLEPRVCKHRGLLKQDCACLRLTGCFSLPPQVFPSEAGLGALPVLQEEDTMYCGSAGSEEALLSQARRDSGQSWADSSKSALVLV